jgi:hypothetical protein
LDVEGATSLNEFGTPNTTTPYTLCLYDSVGGVPQRRLRKVIPAGSHWKPYSRGFHYRDSTLSAGGIQSITLTEGAAGKASIQVRGKGQPLGLPALPLTKQPSVTIQLLNDNACWSSTYSTSTNNDGVLQGEEHRSVQTPWWTRPVEATASSPVPQVSHWLGISARNWPRPAAAPPVPRPLIGSLAARTG